MKLQEATLAQVADIDGLSQISLICKNPVSFVPGQYIALWVNGQPESLPYTPFIQSSSGNILTLTPDELPAWQPGQILGWRGPLGAACRLPENMRKLALYSRADHPGPLMPFIQSGIQGGMDTVYCSSQSTGYSAWLPSHIEWEDHSRLAEIASWADMLIACLPRQTLSEELEKLSNLPASVKPDRIYILVVSPMPCNGIAQCGVCDIRLRHKAIHICQDGPLFPLKDLI